MIHSITLSLLLLTNVLLAQIPEKAQLMEAYYVGHKAFEALHTLNHKLIEIYFKDTANLSFIIKEIESKKLHKDSIRITKDIMYNQDTKNYEFLVYGGKYISTEDDWGLYDYYFVIQINIDLRKEKLETQILKTSIIKSKDLGELKIWWQNYMKSYSESKYAKNEIADKYGLVPPPPPPPATKAWFE